MIGFILQFVGLRGLHSSVAMFQLGITLIMAGLRAGLRAQRLGEERNGLSRIADLVEGHELDWQAFTLPTCDESQKVLKWYIADDFSFSKSPKDNCETEPNFGAKIVEIRARLGRLTDGEASTSWQTEVRRCAVRLKDAIENVANVIFSGSMPLKEEWQGTSTVVWTVNCQLEHWSGRKAIHPISLRLQLRHDMWEIEKSRLEAVLGLWSWSLARYLTERQISQITSEKFFAAAHLPEAEKVELDLKMWALRDFDHVKKKITDIPSKVMETGNLNGSYTVEEVDNPENTRTRHEVGLEGWGDNGSEPSPKWTILSVPTASALFSSRVVPSNSGKVTIFSVPSRNSLRVMCAQDLFTSFIGNIADMISVLTDITPLRRQTLEGRAGGWDSSHSQDSVQFTNPHVENIATAFTQAGIGSREDALMSIIPPLLVRSKFPWSDKKTLSWIIKQRHSNRFAEAQDYILWSYYNIRDTLARLPELENVVRALGELYRRAMRAPGNDILIWRIGYEGILWMLRTLSPLHMPVNTIKENYGWVGYQMAEMTGQEQLSRMFKDAGADPEKVPNFREISLLDALETDKVYPIGLLIGGGRK